MTEQRISPGVVRLRVPEIDRIRLGARIFCLPRETRVALSFYLLCR
jgi:hypothetical protein